MARGRKKKPQPKPQEFSSWAKGQGQTASLPKATKLSDLYEQAPVAQGSPRLPEYKRTQQYVQSYNAPKEQEFKNWIDTKLSGSRSERSATLKMFGKEYGSNMDKKESTIRSQLNLPTVNPNKYSKKEEDTKVSKTTKPSASTSKALQNVQKDDSRGGGFFDNLKQFGKSILKGDLKGAAMAGVKQGQEQGKVGKEVDRAATRITNSALLGLPKALDSKSSAPTPQEYSQRAGGGKAADFVYDAAGYIAPGTGAAKILRGTGVTKGTGNLAKEIVKGNTKGNIGKMAKATAKEGAIIGGGLSAGEEAIKATANPQDFNAKQAATNIALNTALGAALDPLISVAAPLVRGSMKSKAIQSTATTAQKQAAKAQADVAKVQTAQTPKAVRQAENSVKNVLATQPKKVTPEVAATRLEAMDSPLSYSQDVKQRLTPRQAAKDMLTTLKRDFVDNASDLKVIERSLRDLDQNNVLKAAPKVGTLVDDSLYKQARLLSSSSARAANSARQTFTPFYDGLRAGNIAAKDFDEYALARHAMDIFDTNAKTGIKTTQLLDEFDGLLSKRPKEMTGPEALEWQKSKKELSQELRDLNPYQLPKEATPEWAEAVLTKWSNNPAMEAAHQNFMQIQRSNLDRARQAGFIDDNVMALLNERHPNYVSLARDVDGGPSMGTGRNKARDPLGIKRKQGSEELKIMPVTESALRNHINTVKNAEKNEMLQTVARYAEIDKDGLMFRKVESPQQGKTVTAYVDGQQQHYEVPDYLVQYLDKSNYAPNDNIVTKAGKEFANLVKKGSTHYNIPFHFVSAVRDSAQAALTSRTGQNPATIAMGFLDSFFGKTLEKATKGRFKSAIDAYEQMGGGATQFVSSKDMDIKDIAKSLETGNLNGNKNMIVLNPFKLIEDFGSRMERGARLGEFRQAKKQGLGDRDAFFEATDMMDYSQKGNMVQKANDYIPYLNAAIRGNARVAEAFKENPKAFSMKAMSYITAPTVALYMSRFAPTTSDKQRDMINNAPDYQKNLYWFAPVPNSDKVAVIPKPHFIGQMFANPVEHVLNQMTGSNVKSGGEEMKQYLKEVGGILTPPNSVAGLNTLLELGANRDFFTGYDIESSFDKYLPKSERYNEYTSEVAKGLGQLPLVDQVASPAQIDHVIKKTTGSLGGQALDVADIASNAAFDTPAKPRTLDDVFGKSAKQFSFNELNSIGTMEDANRAKAREQSGASKEEKKELRKTESATSYQKQLDDIRKEIKDIQKDPDMTATDKKEYIKQLREEQRAIGSDFIQWYNSLRK